ncbi:uncharacterized protein BX663DRAFT_506084 [Cokeromyces recurvatus]|uniref:uncharacterized protein n=1 Tax=Cokeromyces recurvatus TaxID=90255 RepID=UPI0022203639|nr:uncharacterized protein BX663DRAFT_506084 [Cokeromyces recurvatus]KAI7904005.1 hypothetical protein BX663DRAFT_506084 [Cokeromyces recurvatus]
MRPNNAIAIERAKVESMIKEQQEAKKREENEKSKSDKREIKKGRNPKRQLKNKRRTKKIAIAKIPKTSLPTPKVYSSDSEDTEYERRISSLAQKKSYINEMSASDSDETDVEKRSSNSKQKEMHVQNTLSASDSDETDKDIPMNKKYTPSKKVSSVQPLSDSDSDETDRESKAPANIKKVMNKSKAEISSSEQSSSSSDESDSDVVNDKAVLNRQYKQRGQTASRIKPRTSEYIHDSSDPSSYSSSSSDESDSNNNEENFTKLRGYIRKRNHLTSNRISFRAKREIDPSKSAAINYATRLSDAFVTNVNPDYFVSDSDSETDSGEDYDRREYPPWQRTLSWNTKPDEIKWPKQRKFGYSDKLKLEKRIKKICRRENISFSEACEIFSSSHRKEYLRFFQKIGKAFPNRSLASIAKQCKEMYHTKRNNAPWTPEEIKKLEELLKIHGNNAVLLSEYMDRSPKNINDFLFGHGHATKKLAKRWSREEDELLAKAVVNKKNVQDGKVSFLSIVPLFKGERSQKQIYARYYTIRHLIQPDGTLAKSRNATPYEELRYLKSLLQQVEKHNLIEESQLDFTKDRGFVHRLFYVKNRANIKGFEKMKIKDILTILIEKQNKIIQSRKEEGLLESE